MRRAFPRVFATNVTGSFLCAREAVRAHVHQARRSRRGYRERVVRRVAAGIARRVCRLRGLEGRDRHAYNRPAREVAEEGIRVNAVRPGIIYTDIHAAGGEPGRVDRVKAFVPMQRGGTAEEVARAILWLLSDEASYTTGAFIDVTGGK